MLTSLLLVLVASAAHVVNGDGDGATWSYTGDGNSIGPSHWGDVDEQCSLDSQSPVDIAEGDTEVDETLGDFTFTDYGANSDNWEFENNGHTLVMNFDSTQGCMTGGGLTGTYCTWQFHIHVGDEDGEGSEHRFNGKQFPLEVHIVHLSNSYPNVTSALESGDSTALAVLGIMFEIGDTPNAALGEMITLKSDARYKGNSTTLTGFAIDALLPSNTSAYARYSGGLTTPPCSEVVTWTVFAETVSMTQAQYDEFVTYFYFDEEGEELMENTFRPVQPLNGRTITTSFQWPSSAPARASLPVSALLLAVLAWFLH